MDKIVTEFEGKKLEFTADEVIRRFQLRGLRRKDGKAMEVLETIKVSKAVKLVSESGSEVLVPAGDHISINKDFVLGHITDEDMELLYIRDVTRLLTSKVINI